VSRTVAYQSHLVVFPTNDLDFTRSLSVFDSLGSAQDITFEFIKVEGPQAAIISGTSGREAEDFLSDAPLLINAGDSFTVSIDGGATTASVPAGGSVDDVTTINDIITQINGIGGGGVAEAYINNDGQLVVSAVDPTVDLTLTDDAGPLLAAFGITSGATVTPAGTLPPDNTVTPPFTDPVFPNLAVDPFSIPPPPPGSFNARGWWQVNVVGPNGAVPLAEGLINFNRDGTLNATADLDGNKNIELRNVDWGNGSNPQDINVDIEGFSQFAGLYNVSFANQNGAELGLKTGIEIDREGYVNARFSNGTLSRLYKLPIATFTSPTNLQEISATSYRESAESGEPLIQEAGVSQAGFLEVNSIEQSNVDLADEFTKLIVTQRAYSANTRVITTVDQMSEDLLRLR